MVSEFETWWHQEGSRPPAVEHDLEEHCKRMCEIAWKNGAFVERDKSFRAGFYAGFIASGEGWNGEYPFQDHARPVIGDQSVEAALTAALASRGDA